MFNLFKKNTKSNISEVTEWDPDKVKVFYEGEVLSPDYVRYTLLYTDGGAHIRKNFNDQPKESFHLLCPDGKGKIVYVEEETNQKGIKKILEQYEGEFSGGQYHGMGELVDRHGEVLSGEFRENKFIGKKDEA